MQVKKYQHRKQKRAMLYGFGNKETPKLTENIETQQPAGNWTETGKLKINFT